MRGEGRGWQDSLACTQRHRHARAHTCLRATHIQGCQAAAPRHGQPHQKLQRDRRADDLQATWVEGPSSGRGRRRDDQPSCWLGKAVGGLERVRVKAYIRAAAEEIWRHLLGARTSARSHAHMAISAVIQSAPAVRGLKDSRHSCARSRLVATPNRTVNTCRRKVVWPNQAVTRIS
jgi:hypothetical protein